MNAEAITYGQLAALGHGTKNNVTAVTQATDIIINVIDHSRSLPPRSTAFQLACKIAAPITHVRTNGLIRQFGADGTAIMDNYKESVVKLVTIEGTVVGIPWALSTPVLYINMDHWKAAGLDPAVIPNTVEDLYAKLAQMQQKTNKAALGYEVNEWEPQAFIQNAGGDVLDANGKPVMDTQQGTAGRRGAIPEVLRHSRGDAALAGNRIPQYDQARTTDSARSGSSLRAVGGWPDAGNGVAGSAWPGSAQGPHRLDLAHR